MRPLDAGAAQRNFRLCRELLARVAAKCAFRPRLRFQAFESKFHRDSDFEIPVAVFFFHVERHATTSRLIIPGGIEQPELINNAVVDGVLGQLKVAAIKVETSLCCREHPRGQSAVFLRNNRADG